MGMGWLRVLNVAVVGVVWLRDVVLEVDDKSWEP